ncbi:pyroglutamyl-peptidase I [Parendozoicomonas haliclonae]|uniref:Pyrrolidone-carboxylate peptidase n=1 Tax=Parendozoicomonas haliclonae TaxID=1960125 RepID=A0A1X7AM37_9GAMM|nr:pyroglutamyl-peptidase I [Parendozoicomonas haliclonae]SMA48755.1 Pyrrolidone-carboxylate peptidase [Parendozoicomonas haliclonae]
MKTVLITGFEPFDGAAINPSLEAAQQLSGLEIPGGVIRTVTVPVVRGKAVDCVLNAVEEIKPDIVILVGQAAGRIGVMPERIAINVDDFRIPDNEGNQAIDLPVVEGGPAAYFTTLPIKAMVKAMGEAGVTSSVSNTAGTFVCNHLFYGVMHALRDTNIKAGFIHIPLIPEQSIKGERPSMMLEAIVKGLRVCAETAVTVDSDIAEVGGQIA